MCVLRGVGSSPSGVEITTGRMPGAARDAWAHTSHDVPGSRSLIATLTAAARSSLNV
eukprot:CAMPEP_0195138602 /NCGR_PEP_ID=MMETSP0448-20130528/157921_1 /TAXON_ID=66468 /ORGANISM="Heterocapsa triquestra, Strain CCMP 448" /LENGTH=56 /DNA_ID=CAMNT_0040176875 /DNA_START=89 /DNA_END=259 /DNA_ORIENTATION=-